MSIQIVNSNVGILQKMLCNTPELEAANKQINNLKKNNSKVFTKNVNTLFYELDVAVIVTQHTYKYVFFILYIFNKFVFFNLFLYEK